MAETEKKRGSRGDATVQKILEASLQRIITHGESGISMTEICAEVGVSRPTIYRYFPTRDALLEAAFEMVISDYLQKLDAKIAAEPNPLRLVDVVAEFAEARLQDGGAQIFHLEPALVIRLMAQSKDRLIEHSEKVFGPLFDMMEAITGRKVDRKSAAKAYLLFSTSLSFFGAQSFAINSGELLRKMIRVLPHFEMSS